MELQNLIERMKAIGTLNKQEVHNAEFPPTPKCAIKEFLYMDSNVTVSLTYNDMKYPQIRRRMLAWKLDIESDLDEARSMRLAKEFLGENAIKISPHESPVLSYMVVESQEVSPPRRARPRRRRRMPQ